MKKKLLSVILAAVLALGVCGALIACGGKTYVKAEFYGDGVLLNTQEVESGKSVTEWKMSDRSGFIFEGWFTTEEATTAYDFTKPITEDVKIYAKWTADPVDHTEWYVTGAFTDPVWTVGNGTKLVREKDLDANGFNVFKAEVEVKDTVTSADDRGFKITYGDTWAVNASKLDKTATPDTVCSGDDNFVLAKNGKFLITLYTKPGDASALRVVVAEVTA